MGNFQSYFHGQEEGLDLWQVQAKGSYNWNLTTPLNWSATNAYIQVAVSPTGELYAIQLYNTVAQNAFQTAYRFNFMTGQWSIVDPKFNTADIKFDKVGNIYLLDVSGNVYSNKDRSTVVLAGVKDFEVTVGQKIYAISTTGTASTNAYTNLFDAVGNGLPFVYK
jgi:hypothetical protein